MIRIIIFWGLCWGPVFFSGTLPFWKTLEFARQTTLFQMLPFWLVARVENGNTGMCQDNGSSVHTPKESEPPHAEQEAGTNNSGKG